MTGPAPAWLVEVPFAHRGLHGDGVPENSLPAMVAAADAGYGIELDVQLSADDHPVVLHDVTLERVAGSPARPRDLAVMDLVRTELEGTVHTIPTLADVLEVVGSRVPVMVELKAFSRRVGRLEHAVAALLDVHEGPFCVSSFNPRSVAWMRRKRPDWVRGQAAGSLADVPMPGWLRPLLRRMAWNRRNQPHFIAYELAALPDATVARAREAGTAVVTWTVRTEEDLAKARQHADNVIFENIRP